MNTQDITSIYFVGIKGIAMTSLAVYVKERGVAVSGSDVDGEFPSSEILAQLGISVHSGFAAGHIATAGNVDLIIYTGAHNGKDNVEVQEAVSRGIPTMSHAEALGMYMTESVQLSIAGSHGKTTTTAMLSLIFSHAGKDPSYAIGSGLVQGLGMPGHFGKGEYFIAEADEYVTDPKHDPRPRFLWQKPRGLIITNIDFDHPDVYQNIDEVKKAFQTLIDQMPSDKIVVYDGDDPQAIVGEGFISVGWTRASHYMLRDLVFSSDATSFQIYEKDIKCAAITLKVPGKHNAKNAAMAAVLAHEFGIPWEVSSKALATFGGAKRRFEYVGTIDDAKVFDDYAHHPKEIETTIQAAKDRFPDAHILVVFQPHTFSRTKSLLGEFVQALRHADTVLLADIYASARESVDSTISSDILAKQIGVEKAIVTLGYTDVRQYISTHRPYTGIILCMGAGDIATWAKQLVADLSKKDA